jgi:hypothetical protein
MISFLLKHLLPGVVLIWLFVLAVTNGVTIAVVVLGILTGIWMLHIGLTISYLIRDVRDELNK